MFVDGALNSIHLSFKGNNHYMQKRMKHISNDDFNYKDFGHKRFIDGASENKIDQGVAL